MITAVIAKELGERLERHCADPRTRDVAPEWIGEYDVPVDVAYELLAAWGARCSPNPT